MRLLEFFCSLFILTLYSCQKIDSLEVELSTENEVNAKYLIKNNRIIKCTLYDKSKKNNEVISYEYANNLLAKVIFDPNNSISGSNLSYEIKIYEDELSQREILTKMDIKLPLSSINKSELRDITYMLTSNQNISDTTDGQTRLIYIKNINLKFRFFPSYLEEFISNENTIYDYELRIGNGNVSNETYIFDTGVLTRSFLWVNENKLVISVKCKYANSEVRSFEKVLSIYRN